MRVSPDACWGIGTHRSHGCHELQALNWLLVGEKQTIHGLISSGLCPAMEVARYHWQEAKSWLFTLNLEAEVCYSWSVLGTGARGEAAVSRQCQSRLRHDSMTHSGTQGSTVKSLISPLRLLIKNQCWSTENWPAGACTLLAFTPVLAAH